MTCVKVIVAVSIAVLWALTAEALTLSWNANTESELAGYRVYQCTTSSCNKSSGTLFATLGKVTSYNIGTPSVTQYYFITAYDLLGNESGSSNVVSSSPSGTPIPPAATPVTLTVVGTPSIGPWGVAATVKDSRDLMAKVYLDGGLHHTENTAPWSFPGDNNVSVLPNRFGRGSHTVEFAFYLQDTSTEVGRASVTVQEGTTSTSSPPPVGTITVSVLGNPASGSWGVSATTSDLRDLMAKVYLDSTLHHTENTVPWSFPEDNGLSVIPNRFGTGSHRVEFVFYLQNTSTEVGRGSVTVQEGTTSSSGSTPVNVTVVGNPATGPWGVSASINDSRDLMAEVFLDSNLHHAENTAPWSFPGDNNVSVLPNRFGRGLHTVEFVFYLQNTATEVGRGSVTVQEG